MCNFHTGRFAYVQAGGMRPHSSKRYRQSKEVALNSKKWKTWNTWYSYKLVPSVHTELQIYLFRRRHPTCVYSTCWHRVHASYYKKEQVRNFHPSEMLHILHPQINWSLLRSNRDLMCRLTQATCNCFFCNKWAAVSNRKFHWIVLHFKHR